MTAETARDNLRQHLVGNPYPGRGIIIGRNDQDHWVQVYWIMGRSENSRNRVFVCEQDTLRTQAADPGAVKDPSLIIYNAMRRLDGIFVVTNGAQTDGIVADMAQGGSFVDALAQWQHEPDAPNFTPRISGIVDDEAGVVWLAVIKCSLFSETQSDHQFHRYMRVEPGYGWAITTYTGDGNPLPSFSGSPYLVPLQGDARQIAMTYWDILDADNRISLAVREITPGSTEMRTEVINKYDVRD